MEVKYGTHPLFAEFFCTITSPAYAAPCSLWFRAEAARFPPGFHVALACCALTALWSTVYHARLSKLFSTLDAGQAVLTFYSVSMLLVGVESLSIHLSVLAAVATAFVYSWRKTATLALILTSFVVPPSMFVLWRNGETGANVAFAAGAAAFLADRCGRAPLHSLWHLLVSYTCLRCCVLALDLHAAGAQPQL